MWYWLTHLAPLPGLGVAAQARIDLLQRRGDEAVRDCAWYVVKVYPLGSESIPYR